MHPRRSKNAQAPTFTRSELGAAPGAEFQTRYSPSQYILVVRVLSRGGVWSRLWLVWGWDGAVAVK